MNFSIEAKDLASSCIAENGDGNQGICWFGEDWQEQKPTKVGPIETGDVFNKGVETKYDWPGVLINKKTCNVNTETNLGKANTDWLPYNYFCIGAQKYDTREQGNNLDNPNYKPADPNSVWVECSQQPAPGIPVVRSSADLVDTIVTPKLSIAQKTIVVPPAPGGFMGSKTVYLDTFSWTEIEYKQKRLPSNCKLCTGSTISSCANWKKPSPSLCKIQTSGTTCTFGNVDGQSANQNCANTRAPYEDRRVEKINGEDYTFFCGTKGRGTSQDGLVYRCKGKIINSYDQVFFTEPKNPADPSSPKLYKSPRPEYNCDTTTEIKEQCDLKGGEQFNTSCIFGSYVSTASDTKKNCAFDNQKFEYRDATGSYRHIVCTPDNVKYTCDNSVKNVPYTTLFSPTFNNAKGGFDYQGTKITKNYDCKPYAPPAEETCTINTKVTKNGDCVVPVGCFKNNKYERTKIGDEEVALYCMSKSGSNKLDGYIYYCPLNSDGTAKNYTDISVENNKYVYLSSFGSECKRYTDTFVNIKLRQSDKFSPLGLIKAVSNLLYYFAIFYFIVLILLNGFAYVRSGEDPSKLKQINESLFNTIAGFIFVLASGGVILYLINSIK